VTFRVVFRRCTYLSWCISPWRRHPKSPIFSFVGTKLPNLWSTLSLYSSRAFSTLNTASSTTQSHSVQILRKRLETFQYSRIHIGAASSPLSLHLIWLFFIVVMQPILASSLWSWTRWLFHWPVDWLIDWWEALTLRLIFICSFQFRFAILTQWPNRFFLFRLFFQLKITFSPVIEKFDRRTWLTDQVRRNHQTKCLAVSDVIRTDKRTQPLALPGLQIGWQRLQCYYISLFYGSSAIKYSKHKIPQQTK